MLSHVQQNCALQGDASRKWCCMPRDKNSGAPRGGKKMKFSKFGLLLGTAMVVAPASAWAQEAPAAPAAEQDDSAVGDIIVTANRREERLQEVPTSITAVTGGTLERSGVNNLRDLPQITPGLTLTRASNAYQPFIRGIGTRNSSTGDEPNVSVYVDGVYQPEMAATALDLVGVERVEVLRGPQGTLFGRNATGGLINVITEDPSHDTKGTAFLSYGRFNEVTGKVYATTGLSDKLSMNISALGTRNDGYIRDVSRGNELVGEREAYLVRTKLLFEPSAGDRIVLALSYGRMKDAANEYRNPYSGNTAARNTPGALITTAPWTAAPTVPHDTNARQFNGSLQTAFDLGGVQFATTTAYQSTRGRNRTDEDHTPVDILHIDADMKSDYFSQEVRLLSQGPGPFNWIVGGYAFLGKGGFERIDLLNPAGIVQRIHAMQTTRSYSVFGEATWEFAENWFLLGGARYTIDTRIYDGISKNAAGATLAQASDKKSTSRAPSFRASLRRDFGDTNVYASFSRGFKGGTFNTGTVSNSPIAVRPEKLDAYEIGIKSNPLRTLQTNLSVFHYDYSDIQLTGRDAVTSLTVLTNAARGRIRGAEFEATFVPVPEFRLSGNVAILDAKYSSFPAAQIFTPILNGAGQPTGTGNVSAIADVSGKQMFRAPKFTASVNADYHVETGAGEFAINGNVFHSSKFFYDVNNRTFQPAYWKINGEVSFTPAGTDLKVAIWGRNLTNEVIYGWVTQTANGDGASYTEPRTYGISLTKKF
ncbi:MAG: TonB-dependent receptor [Sphingomonadales bacterium]|nr:MAG: TonB-dependent receptor [Sphingomonadales bacterium]